MCKYRTLTGKVFDLGILPQAHLRVYESLKDYFEQGPTWNEFAIRWTNETREIFESSAIERVTETPLFQICQDLESRLGIKQGFVKPVPDFQSEIKELGVADNGKLLIVFYAADQINLPIENDLDSYIFLLDAYGTLPFTYPFRFEPLPYSVPLHEDLYGLEQSKYIAKHSPLSITEKGKDWVSAELSDCASFRGGLDEIGEQIKEFSCWGKSELFKAVYSVITG